MLKRIVYNDRESWLAGRGKSIGASEAAAAIGMSPFESPYELWARKTGRIPAKDLSGNSAVEYGNRLEPILRAMFQAEHPEFELDYHQFDVLYQHERPWMTATLDGELIDVEDGTKGILEIKTANVGRKSQWEKWHDAIPIGYLAQVLHQLLVTGWDFVILYAKLIKLNGDSELRTYRFDAADRKEDMQWLLEQETAFWENHILADVPPAVKLGVL